MQTRKLLPAIAALLLLASGCANAISSGGCPTLVDYSDDFLDAADAELATIETSHPHVTTMIDDYGMNRDQIRVCRGERWGGLASLIGG